ncbi:MAG: serine/threonine protein kinase, partial [Myxococcales bacterium]|nr:serine/threonine protein kinase [Myxococcales bacterium]
MRGASTTPREGLIVDHFRLEHELGRGATGLVFSAQDLRLERRVAIKFLDPALALEPDYRRRFVREARTAAKLHHPNVATVFEAGETESRLYLVMELVEGEPLSARIEREGRLPLFEALGIASQVLAGLEQAHLVGVIHRDVKPDNVLVTDRDEAKLVDFGVAHLENTEAQLTQRGEVLGTPAYLS